MRRGTKSSAAIKKKHSKTAGETRYQGTLLGRESEMQPVAIAGGPHDSISSWAASRNQDNPTLAREDTPLSSVVSSALSTT